MKKGIALLGLFVGGILLVVFAQKSWLLNFGSVQPVTPVIASSTIETTDTIPAVAEEPAPPLGKEYKNAKYRFSLMIPEDFRAEQLPRDDEGRDTVLLQNAKGDGIQILITKDDAHQTTLTADDVRGSIPDMRVQAEQSVEIGPENRGVAFKSDNEAFQGNSREVWFYFNGNLYQISTYARLDPLLKSMFGTWKFF